MEFLLNLNTKIIAKDPSVPVKNAVSILKRDMKTVLTSTDFAENSIILVYDSELEAETYSISVGADIDIYASDDLGFIYALLFISERFLGVKPFWFWMDRLPSKIECVSVPHGIYSSPKPVVKYRGWFLNDEVLIMKWGNEQAWQMAFEALLRCGGNMVIPGTDKLARKNNRLAAEMGLWITHHHAEPLGAEMFVRAYPGQNANFMDSPELFYKLWEDAVIAQKDYKVVWNLCFRGQGDCPFWSSDTSGRFDTSDKRGMLISEIIEKQREIVKKHVKNPVFCTNLYGEIMELYKEGYIKLDDDIIKVRADNGYGKMVTRRRDNHSVRVAAMPEKNAGYQGIYYHVSFYDLQAANHITMLPNSVDFVSRELSAVLENDGSDFWIINCSNVRPHTYFLDAIRKKWFGKAVSDASHSREFAADYYPAVPEAAACLSGYAEAMTAYADEEDEHAGEQLYTETSRLIAHQMLVNRDAPIGALRWLADFDTLREQAEYICGLCKKNIGSLGGYYEYCALCAGDKVFDATVLLQAKIHYYCAKGLIEICEACEKFFKGDYKAAFILAGDAQADFNYANSELRGAEYGVWENFYYNDCFADIKHSAYMANKLMGLMREFGDNARHDKWYREAIYAPEDRDVFLLLVTDNHMTDAELYEIMKNN